MKPGDLIRTADTSVFRGEEMGPFPYEEVGVILEETKHGFVVLFANGTVKPGTRAYFCNFYQVVE